MPLFIYSTPLPKKTPKPFSCTASHALSGGKLLTPTCSWVFLLTKRHLARCAECWAPKGFSCDQKTKVRCQVWQTKKFGFLVGLVGSRVEKFSGLFLWKLFAKTSKHHYHCHHCWAPNSKITLKYPSFFLFQHDSICLTACLHCYHFNSANICWPTSQYHVCFSPFPKTITCDYVSMWV